MAVHVAPLLKPVIENVAAVPSAAGSGVSATVPLSQLRPILTFRELSSEKSFVTVNVAEETLARVLMIVHDGEAPRVIATPRQSLAFGVYPDGTELSLAVQVARLPNRVILKEAGAASVAVFCDLSGVPPFVQSTETVTDAPRTSGTKSLWTTSVAEMTPLRLFVIVQERDWPAAIETSRQPCSVAM